MNLILKIGLCFLFVGCLNRSVYTCAQTRIKPDSIITMQGRMCHLTVSPRSWLIKSSSGAQPTGGRELENLNFADGFGMQDAVLAVLDTNRLKALLPEMSFMCVCRLNNEGNIIQVSFSVQRNTLLYMEEVDRVQNLMLTKMRVIIPLGQKHMGPFGPIGQGMHFAKLLDIARHRPDALH